MKPTATIEEQALQSIKRACYAGLDSLQLRLEVLRRTERAVPAEGYSFATTDPDTGLMTHSLLSGIPAGMLREYMERVYPEEGAMRKIDLANAGVVVEVDSGPQSRSVLAAYGMRHEMFALLHTPGALWGNWCLLRGSDAAPFSERERRFMKRIAPHVARGMRGAAIMELGRQARGAGAGADADAGADAGADDGDGGPGPGVLVLDGRGRPVLRTATAAAHLADLARRDGVGPEVLPFPVASVCGRLRWRHRHAAPDEPEEARVRAQGGSGRWYALRASLAEPDAAGEAATVVTIEPVERRDVGPLLFRLYGLSAREREVLAAVVRGEPTKCIAAVMGLSVHTVQGYLDRACEKVGARGRKALVAKLFREGYAPALTG